MNFCQGNGLSPFPLSELVLCRFVAHLFEQSLSINTIRLYLSALRFVQISRGGGDPSMTSLPRLHYVLRGIARSQPKASRPARLPITIEVLEKLFRAWAAVAPNYENTMLWAACTLAFFAFLRCGEFTSVSSNRPVILAASDVEVDNCHNPTYLRLTLRGSKTDPFGASCALFVGRTHTQVCPVSAVLAYLSIRPSTPGPLFIQADGTPLSRTALVTAVRAALSTTGMDLSRFTGHSFRIGAATTAAQAGLSDSLIQTLGRWRSSAFTRYIRTPSTVLLSVARTLSHHTSPP